MKSSTLPLGLFKVRIEKEKKEIIKDIFLDPFCKGHPKSYVYTRSTNITHCANVINYLGQS